MERMFYLSEAFNSDISSWVIQNVDTMASMLENATSFDQDLCAWSDNFPYNSAGDIFTSSGCTYADEPKCDELKLGPFCASFCPPTPDLCSPSAVRSIRFHACLLHPDVCFLTYAYRIILLVLCSRRQNSQSLQTQHQMHHQIPLPIQIHCQ